MIRTGKLKRETVTLVWKHPSGPGSKDVPFYSEAGSDVQWHGATNEGDERHYGGRTLLWCSVWNDELGMWCSKGLELEEVEWDE